MALEAIAAVEGAERAAEDVKNSAAKEAKRRIAQANADGAAMMDAALKKAEAELAVLAAEAETRSKAGADEIRRNTDHEIGCLRAEAEGRLQAAAKHIAERIVNE